MKAIKASTALILLLAALGGGDASGQSGESWYARARADRVNLRAKPDPVGEVVTQLALDERVPVLEVQESWVRVTPPDRVELWVHRDLVKDGLSAGDKVNIRAGAGIHFSVVGQYTRGERIEERGQFGEWIKVGPSNASVWVSRDWVELLAKTPLAEPAPAPLAEATPMPPPAEALPADSGEPGLGPVVVGAPDAAAQPVLTAGAEPPRDLKLVPLEGQGRLIEKEGELKTAPFIFGRPSKFRLTQREGNQLKTLCYVRGNTAQLESLLNERLLIRGREYWVQGVKQPVLVPERIERPVR